MHTYNTYIHTYIIQGGKPPIEGTFLFPSWEVKALSIEMLGLSQAFGYALGYVCMYVCKYVCEDMKFLAFHRPLDMRAHMYTYMHTYIHS